MLDTNIRNIFQQARKRSCDLKEGWMKNDEGWLNNDEGWWFQAVEGFCDWLTDGHLWM